MEYEKDIWGIKKNLAVSLCQEPLWWFEKEAQMIGQDGMGIGPDKHV